MSDLAITLKEVEYKQKLYGFNATKFADKTASQWEDKINEKDDILEEKINTEVSRALAAEEAIRTDLQNKINNETAARTEAIEYVNDDIDNLRNELDAKVNKLIGSEEELARIEDNIAVFNDEGGIKDSRKKLEQLATKEELDNKQNQLRAGPGITIADDVISAIYSHELTPEALSEVLEGSDSIDVTLNEPKTKLQVKLNQDITNKINTLDTEVQTLNTKVNTLNTKVQTLDTKVGALDTEVGKKQPKIGDLNDIRAGAEAGSTAVQPDMLTSYAKKSDLQKTLSLDNDFTLSKEIGYLQVGAKIGKDEPIYSILRRLFGIGSEPAVEPKVYFYEGRTSPTTVDDNWTNEITSRSIIDTGINHIYSGGYIGYLGVAYPKEFGELLHIYQNGLTDFDLLSDTECSEVVIENVNYYMYLFTEKAFINNDTYDYLFK